METILVTGNNGSLGRNLSNLLSFKGYKVVGTDGYDLTEEMEVKELFVKNSEVKTVVHLAAVQNSDTNVFQKNTKMTENLIKYCVPQSKIIFASSNTVYGNFSVNAQNFNNSGPCTKKEVLAKENDVTKPTSNYGASKLACENLLVVAALQQKVSFTNIRLSAIVGKDTRFGAFRDLFAQVKSNPNIVAALGSANGSVKNFVHVDDVSSFICYLIRNEMVFRNDTVNLCGKNGLSIKEMIDLMGETIHWKVPKITWNYKSNPNDNTLLLMDTSKLLDGNWQPNFKTSRSAVMAAIKDKLLWESNKNE